MKALLISVGTGVKATRKAVEDLASALAFAINNQNPDKLFLVVSEGSQKTTLPKILTKVTVRNHEAIIVRNPDAIEEIYEDLQPRLEQIRKEYTHVAIDYTSGTKAMTAALVILGSIYEADTLNYVTGRRKNGTVEKGTEKIHAVRPTFASAEQKIKTAAKFFNQNQFTATITLLNQIGKTTSDTKIANRIKPLKKLAQAYKQWDSFQHQDAFQTLKKIEKEELNQNKRFLGQLLNAKDPEPYYIADLINNAKRRGTEEKKYDDAVARLYRTIELIAHHQLKTKYNIDPSAAKPTDMPKELLKKWNITQATANIRIGLEKAYELLNAKNHPLGTTFTQDNKLKDLLSKRNTSILAHNLKPVTKKTYTELYNKTTEYAASTIKNLKQLTNDSAFTKWTE